MLTPIQITHSRPPEWTAVEYSSVSPFNSDNAYILFVQRDHFALHHGDGTFIRALRIAASQEPRWSRSHPQVLYFHSLMGNQLFQYDVHQDAATLIHTFSEYSTISGLGEAEISRDGFHLVYAGTRLDGVKEIFIYDLSANTKGQIFVQTESVDGLRITASNHVIVSKPSGIVVLNLPDRTIAAVNGHAAESVYQGRPVFLWCSAADLQLNKNALVMIDVDSGHHEILYELDWRYAFHISSCDHEWCMVSTDCPDRTLPSQCWKIHFDKSIPPELICDTASVYTGYNSQVKAALSRDGSRLVGCSNFGHTDDANYCDVFMVHLAEAIPVLPTADIRIDYAAYVGKSVFIMVPRPDGAVDIYERKV